MDFVVSVDINKDIALHRQLYAELQKAILTGRLKPGEKLPSSRNLAKLLGLSRTTVTQSYEDLISEGYLETSLGSGTFVCENLPERLLKAKSINDVNTTNILDESKFKLSDYSQRLAKIPSMLADSEINVTFRAWSPDLEEFPLKEWGKILSRYCRTGKKNLLGYSIDSSGYKPLKEAIAAYLTRSRAVCCNTEQIVIVNGSQQALDFISRIFINPGDGVVMEEPGYLGAKQAFFTYGAKIYPVNVDNNGIVVDQLKELKAETLKLVYVTPSHQFPTGAVLSLPRRLELLAWAKSENVVIIEDDYDSEYRYGGRPIPALQGLNLNNNVIYIGTFSKVLFPALRIGYLVIPSSLVPIFSQAKYLTDRLCSTMDQYVLTEFINTGALERHIRQMRIIYNKRRETLVTSLTKHFGDNIEIVGENAGMHLMVRLKLGLSEQEVAKKLANKRIELISAQNYYLQPNKENEYILGYATLNQKAIKDAVIKLAEALL
jgi:GntR family transcriptional regulator/MocR family aminotransferase